MQLPRRRISEISEYNKEKVNWEKKKPLPARRKSMRKEIQEGKDSF